MALGTPTGRTTGRLALLSAIVSFLALPVAACGGGEDRVELRLQPCDIDGFPRSVRVRVEAFDADGAALGEPKSEAFAIPEPSIFDDGYATVGYVPPAGAISATVTIGWFAETNAGSLAASDHVVLWPNVKLPALGESVELSAEGCEPFGGTSGTGTTTEGTATEGTTTEGTTTEGTTTEGTTTEGTTTEGTTTEGTTTGTTTTGTTTTGTTTGSTTEGTTTTGGDTLEGTPCEADDLPVCETPGPGEIGALLRCIGDIWTEDAAGLCDAICADAFYGFNDGEAVGCSGNGSGIAWGCLCVEGNEVTPCDGNDELCTVKNRSQLIQLCVDGNLVKGTCPETCSDDLAPICAV